MFNQTEQEHYRDKEKLRDEISALQSSLEATEKELERYKGIYKSACKGRGDFRKAFRASRERVKELEARKNQALKLFKEIPTVIRDGKLSVTKLLHKMNTIRETLATPFPPKALTKGEK